jgi:hypothetical protein
MPLPAERVALSHVDSSRKQGPRGQARTDAKVRGSLWRRQPEYRAPGDVVLPGLQRRDVRGLRASAAAPSAPRPTHDHRAGQRCVPPRTIAQAAAAKTPSAPGLVLPAAIQPAAFNHRTGLKAHPAAGYLQQVLLNVARIAGCGHGLLPPVAEAERETTPAMLHYLRRLV